MKHLGNTPDGTGVIIQFSSAEMEAFEELIYTTRVADQAMAAGSDARDIDVCEVLKITSKFVRACLQMHETKKDVQYLGAILSNQRG